MMNYEQLNIKLFKEIEHFVKNKIKNIKCADEILDNSSFAISKSKNQNNSESFFHLYKFKKHLQLILNLYNDFKMYENFEIKCHPKENNFNRDPLESFYRYDPGNGLWKCFGRPSERDVVFAVYDYIECFLLLKQSNETKKEDFLSDIAGIDRCPFCDNEVVEGEEKCSICCASIQEMLNERTKVIAGNKIEDKEFRSIEVEREVDNSGRKNVNDVERGNVIAEERMDVDECFLENNLQEMKSQGSEKRESRGAMSHPLQCDIGDDRSMITGGQMYANMECTNEVQGSRGRRSDRMLDMANKWECTTCGYFNGDEFVSCETCNGRRNNCKHGEVEGCCALCNVMNPSIDATRNNDQSRKNQWQCSKCDMWQMYSYIVCSKCGAAREDCGVWICDQCTLVNKCTMSRCEACDKINDHLDRRRCKKCSNIINGTRDYCDGCARHDHGNMASSVRWQCMFGHCRAWNDEDNKYCNVCHLSRFSSRKRGDPVKLQTKYGDYSVWICHRCHRSNDLRISICSSSYCGGTRYMGQYCYSCLKMSSATSWRCDYCHIRL